MALFWVEVAEVMAEEGSRNAVKLRRLIPYKGDNLRIKKLTCIEIGNKLYIYTKLLHQFLNTSDTITAIYISFELIKLRRSHDNSAE